MGETRLFFLTLLATFCDFTQIQYDELHDFNLKIEVMDGGNIAGVDLHYIFQRNTY